MKLILPLNNTKQIFSLTLKYTLFVSKLTILILLSIAHLFAGEEERKGPDAKYSVRKYDDALTQELDELIVSNGPFEKTIEKIQTLICNGANPNTKISSPPLLIIACQTNNIPYIKACLKHGSYVNAIEPKSGMSPLFFAYSGPAVQVLLDAHADVTIKKILGTDNPFIIGAQALHYASAAERYSPEVVEILCNKTPTDPIPIDALGRTPLYYSCMQKGSIKTNIFFPKAAALLWWLLEQKNIKYKEKTPRDWLEKKNGPGAYHLIDGFNALIYDVQRAQAQLSPIHAMAFTPPMRLKEFNQMMDTFAKNKLKLLITKQLYSDKQLVVNGIADIIVSYADRFTPYPTYPAIVYQEGDGDEYLPNTRHISEEYLLSIQHILKEKKQTKKNV